jgi:NAD(P)H-dependent FMN reductase
MAKSLYIPVLLGTVRQGRASEAVARYVHSKLAAHPNVETRLIDIRDLNLPMTDEGESLAELNKDYVAEIERCDGLLIVSPEYNHGYPGSLKRALDICFAQYKHKAAAIAGVSSGSFGGVRMIEQLSNVLRDFYMAVSRYDMVFPMAPNGFDESGQPKDPAVHGRTEEAITELIFLAASMKWGRENLK